MSDKTIELATAELTAGAAPFLEGSVFLSLFYIIQYMYFVSV